MAEPEATVRGLLAVAAAVNRANRIRK